ncbi:MAG: site-2 protease family protein [Thioalkalivibrionaceae bacterium]
MDDLLRLMAIWALPVLFAITVHEAAHGYAARALGDSTAAMLGRLTFNPLKHVDPVGTLAVPIALLLLSSFTPGPPFVFGWAKPVPVNTRNLKQPRRDMALVAAAGPGANLVMALLWGLLIHLGLLLDGPYSEAMVAMGLAGIAINILLMVLNLLPIPPLDGGRVVSSLLPGRMSYWYDRLEPFGLVIVLGLLLTGLLGLILQPLYRGGIDAVVGVLGLPF